MAPTPDPNGQARLLQSPASPFSIESLPIDKRPLHESFADEYITKQRDMSKARNEAKLFVASNGAFSCVGPAGSNGEPIGGCTHTVATLDKFLIAWPDIKIQKQEAAAATVHHSSSTRCRVLRATTLTQRPSWTAVPGLGDQIKHKLHLESPKGATPAADQAKQGTKRSSFTQDESSPAKALSTDDAKSTPASVDTCAMAFRQSVTSATNMMAPEAESNSLGGHCNVSGVTTVEQIYASTARSDHPSSHIEAEDGASNLSSVAMHQAQLDQGDGHDANLNGQQQTVTTARPHLNMMLTPSTSAEPRSATQSTPYTQPQIDSVVGLFMQGGFSGEALERAFNEVAARGHWHQRTAESLMNILRLEIDNFDELLALVEDETKQEDGEGAA